MNVLKQVLQSIDDRCLGLLGAVLSEDECKVRAGVTAAVPRVIESMVAVNEIHQGRDMLWRELRDTDATVANRFAENLYYQNSKSLCAAGHDQLDGLLGVEAQNLIRSVSRDADLGSTSARRLVGAVTPLVFSSVAQLQQSKQLDESELGEIISQQSGYLQTWRQQRDNYLSNQADDSDQSDKPLFDSLHHTYDSDHSVAGFAAAASAAARSATADDVNSSDDKDSADANRVETAGGAVAQMVHQPTNKTDTTDEKRLWIPASAATDRDQNNNLQYPTKSPEKNAPSAKKAKSGGGIHWLWWPVFILGSILAISILFSESWKDFAKTDAADPTPEQPSELTANEVADKNERAFALQDQERNEGSTVPTEENPINSDQETKPADDGPAIEAPSDAAQSGSNLNLNLDADSETNADSNADSNDKADSGSSSDANANTNTAAATVDHEGSEDAAEQIVDQLSDLDADDQVEALITDIETELSTIENLQSAKSVKASLSQNVSALKLVTSGRDHWKDEVVILVDFQMVEGKKMLDAVKARIFEQQGVQNELSPLLKKLGETMNSPSR